MAGDGYAWWRSRLHHMAQYFAAYRIDHVLGFFRIWEVPGARCGRAGGGGGRMRFGGGAPCVRVCWGGLLAWALGLA